jgi:hypothetical protein
MGTFRILTQRNTGVREIRTETGRKDMKRKEEMV